MAVSAVFRVEPLTTMVHHTLGMSAEDHTLLRALSAALSANPFAAKVNVLGVTLSRSAARALERQMLRLRVAERRAA